MFSDSVLDKLFYYLTVGFGEWSPRSWDLAPLDYFIWGLRKSQIYKNSSQSVSNLNSKVIRIIGDIKPQLS